MAGESRWLGASARGRGRAGAPLRLAGWVSQDPRRERSRSPLRLARDRSEAALRILQTILVQTLNIFLGGLYQTGLVFSGVKFLVKEPARVLFLRTFSAGLAGTPPPEGFRTEDLEAQSSSVEELAEQDLQLVGWRQDHEALRYGGRSTR
jgi:hypothetical protein